LSLCNNISSSAFFHVIQEFLPTLLIDEADTNLRGSDELRGILNAGYFKANAFVWRGFPLLSAKSAKSAVSL